jgi:threonylcarbamoyladenosine tRNA methylthiotransferase MtaB
LKIQEGCNAFCTYCIIPYGRGPSRSLSAEQVVAHARALVAQGAREIIVTGTNIGDYGVDWGQDPLRALPDLFERLLGETSLERLRVGSLDPSEISESLLRLMERDPRFCPHLHVSLQSTHPRILRLMKRKYGIEQVRDCLQRIAELPAPLGGAIVGMDLITGFPGEGPEEFEAAYSELERLPWSRLHVFPYSERAGTPATRLPGSVPAQERAKRSQKLSQLSLSRQQALQERVLASGRPVEGVLLEKPQALSDGTARSCGYTANYLKIALTLPSEKAQSLRNRLVSVLPQQLIVDRAQGEVSLSGLLQSSE